MDGSSNGGLTQFCELLTVVHCPSKDLTVSGRILSIKFQVIPGNLQKYLSTNRSLLQCKSLPAHFSNNKSFFIH